MNFKKDNFLFGFFIGFIFPLILFFFGKWMQNETQVLFNESTMYAVSCIINLPFFRFYMINAHKDKTGRGILFATFLHVFHYLYKYMM